jgi:hypothetical protein
MLLCAEYPGRYICASLQNIRRENSIPYFSLLILYSGFALPYSANVPSSRHAGLKETAGGRTAELYLKE